MKHGGSRRGRGKKMLLGVGELLEKAIRVGILRKQYCLLVGTQGALQLGTMWLQRCVRFGIPGPALICRTGFLLLNAQIAEASCDLGAGAHGAIGDGLLWARNVKSRTSGCNRRV